MKAIPVAVLVLACGGLLAADTPPAADLKARVSAILARFPAETPAKKRRKVKVSA